jgi:hypothetical protein
MLDSLTSLLDELPVKPDLSIGCKLAFIVIVFAPYGAYCIDSQSLFQAREPLLR